jgi:hypothetical protein
MEQLERLALSLGDAAIGVNTKIGVFPAFEKLDSLPLMVVLFVACVVSPAAFLTLGILFPAAADDTRFWL